MKIRKRKFTEKDAGGNVTDIYCKGCGDLIATENLVTRSDGVKGLRFARLGNYVEIKMQFKDGSYHVTNGCKRCLNLNLKPAALQRLYNADVAHDPNSYSKRDADRQAERVVAIGVGLP